MSRVLYELVGRDDRRFSPNCWRARMALAHKGLDLDEIVPCRFTEKDKFAFSGGKTVPVLVDGDRNLTDSWDIACYLEDAYPDAPSLFRGAEGLAYARFLNGWVNQTLHPAVLLTVIEGVFNTIDPADTAYFRESREARFGAPLEALFAQCAERGAALEKVLAPLRTPLADQPYLCGDAPAYGDYLVFGAFQWARCVSPDPIVRPDDGLIYGWRERMLDLFDGLVRNVPT